MTFRDDDATREHLQIGLDHILAALAACGSVPLAEPIDALDTALQFDESYQEARVAFSAVLHGLLDLLPEGPTRTQVFRVEEAANTLVSDATLAAWRLGMLAQRDWKNS